MENIKQASFVKRANVTVFMQQYFTCSIYSKTLLQKAFIVTLSQFYDRTNFFESDERFFQNFESSLELQRAIRKLPDIHGLNILELYNVLTLFRMGFCVAAHGWVGGGSLFGPPLPKIRHTYPKIMKISTVLRGLRKIKKM